MQQILKQFVTSSCALCVSFLFVTLDSIAAEKDTRAAAIVGDKIITYQQMNDPIASKIYEAEQKLYELKLVQLKTQILAQLIKKNPLSAGKSVEEFIQRYITTNVQVTQADIQQFVVLKKIPKEQLDATLLEKVRSYLVQQHSAKQIENWVNIESKKQGVIINLRPPIPTRVEIAINGAPVLGPKNAPITIIEYSDFQCPFCTRAEVTVKQLLKNYPGKIKVVYKQFPLSFHQDAFKAAEASLCANEQSDEYFWELHDHMLANPRKLTAGALVEKASSMGLNKTQFEQCVKSSKYASKVNQDIDEGQRLGVEATPMFYINGITVRGAQPLEAFVKVIESELALLATNRK
ncbi:MAG: DsbA family protein [Kangiellaceae bacterium]|nr:DsbA family protein [Kangiellaceae bacterium]